MTTSASAFSLPPEILSMIVSLNEDSLNAMRLVSRSWNFAVMAHLNDRRYKPVLERVFIRGAKDADFDEKEEEEEDDNTWKQIRMWAIVPEECAPERIGLGDWLSISERFPKSIEVCCAPQTIDRWYNEEGKREVSLSTTLGGCLLGAALACASSKGILFPRCSPTLEFVLIAIPPAICLYRSRYGESSGNQSSMTIAKKTPNRKLTRFFSMFSQIDTVVIEGYSTSWFYAMETMGEIHVKKLEIRCDIRSWSNKQKIIELARKHRIQHVSIFSYSFTPHNFSKFVIELVRLGAALDVYGKERTVKIFRRSRSFWERKEEELKREGIEMKIEHVLDTNLDVHIRYVKTHISIRSSEETTSDFTPDIRGYRSKGCY